MREDLAISLDRVSKSYRLFGSQRQQLLDILGLGRFAGNSGYKEFTALRDVSLEVPKGHRVGIVGRNGAGKTTLLKLICGNFTPTSGAIDVQGHVQALMGSGIGFHPEYTGRENALASLQYNGLARGEYEAALDDIIDFCELGDFIDQPFKTYSLGMQARLMFATSTAIRPDILIVDEVLGAGDGYFIAKSRKRMERLVRGGCTMLLVSHSTQQVLEMCQEAIWLDQGAIRMQDEAFRVVKAYEEFIHGSTKAFSLPNVESDAAQSKPAKTDSPLRVTGPSGGAKLQEPSFQPHAAKDPLPGSVPWQSGFRFVARGGLSRWHGEPGLKVCGLDFVGPRGSGNDVLSLEPLEIRLTVQAERSGAFRCRYGFVVNDIHGRVVTKIFSSLDEFALDEDGTRSLTILLNPLQLGPGEYTGGVALWEYGPLETINSARRFDVLSRSFDLRVRLPDSLGATDCLFYHTAEWTFGVDGPSDDAVVLQASQEPCT